jgi:hypothetical protein
MLAALFAGKKIEDKHTVVHAKVGKDCVLVKLLCNDDLC